MSTPKLEEIADRTWRHVSALERGIHDSGSPVILDALREAVEAAVAQRDAEWQYKIDTEGKTAVLATLRAAVEQEREALKRRRLARSRAEEPKPGRRIREGCAHEVPKRMSWMCGRCGRAIQWREKEEK